MILKVSRQRHHFFGLPKNASIPLFHHCCFSARLRLPGNLLAVTVRLVDVGRASRVLKSILLEARTVTAADLVDRSIVRGSG
jgi:hypothetical protein